MSLTIIIPDPQAPMITVRGLWLTADRKSVVKAGDPKAAFSLGNEIPRAQAEALGLLAPPPIPAAGVPTPAPEPPSEPVKEPEEPKQAPQPADKQAAQPKNKSRTTAARKRG